MGVTLKINTSGATEALAYIRKMTKRTSGSPGLPPVMKVMASDLVRFMQNGIEQEIDAEGRRFEALKESTLHARAQKASGTRAGRGTRAERAAKTRANRYKKSGGWKAKYARGMEKALAPGGIRILRDTGRLFQSLFAEAVSKTSFRFGGAMYLVDHQTGTSKMVARTVAPIEFTGGGWQPILRGRAGELFAKFRQQMADYIVSGDVK